MRLRGALVGAGNIALAGHGPQWARNEALRRDVDIVAVADLSPANLEAARGLFPKAKGYLDVRELWDREAVDFADICTPPFTHRALVEEAAERGIHVLCEKPLAPSVPDALGIADAVRRSGIVFEPCHQYHHSPDWQVVRGLVARLGRIYFAEYEVHRTHANEGSQNWAPSWRTDKALAGGGILVDHGAHIFYQLRAILGEPQSVQATVRTLLHHAYGVEDTALVTLDFGKGLAQVRLSWASRRRQIRFHFIGERGELTGDDHGVRVQADTTVEIDFGGGMSRGSSHSDWYAPLFRGFADRVMARDLRHDSLDEAMYVTRLIERAYESSRQGRALPLHVAPAPRMAAHIGVQEGVAS